MAGFPAGSAFRHGVFTPLAVPKPVRKPTLDVGSLDAALRQVSQESHAPRGAGPQTKTSIFGKGASLGG